MFIVLFIGILLTGISYYLLQSYNSADNKEKQDKVSVLPQDDPTETICFTSTGDILMHNTVIWSGLLDDGSYSYNHLFAPVKSLIQEGDYSLVNLESAIAGPAAGYTGYPRFNSPDAIADTIKDSGFDMVITANNHILDKDLQGTLRTIDILQKAGLDTTGSFRSQKEKDSPLIRDIRGIKVGFLAYTYGTNGIPVPKDTPYLVNILDKDTVLADINSIRPDVDILVLVLHWGIEYTPEPSNEQREMAREFLTAGTDLIIGSHPHVIQPMEIMEINGKNKPVIYSMGNSISHQRGIERNSGAIFKIKYTKNLSTGLTSLTELSYTPTFSHHYYENGRLMFRVVDVKQAISDIQNGNEPYLNSSNLPVLEQVLEATTKQLGPAFYAKENS